MTHAIEDLEEVQIGPHAHQVTKISTSLFVEEEQELVDRLRINVNMFAWPPSDMLGIYTKVVSHRLTIHPSTKLVEQRKRK